MEEVEDGVEGPGRPYVVGLFLDVEDLLGDGVEEEVEQPVNEDSDEDEPQRVTLSEMGLELKIRKNVLFRWMWRRSIIYRPWLRLWQW